MKISSLTLTFVHMTWKSIGVISSLGEITVPRFATFEQKSRRYWADNIFSMTSGMILTFYHVTWKTIEVIYSLGTFPVPNLAYFNQRGLKIVSWQYISMTNSLPLTFDHLTLKIRIICAQFFQKQGYSC